MVEDIRKKAEDLVKALQAASDAYLTECFPTLSKPTVTGSPHARRWFIIRMNRRGRDEELAAVDLTTGDVKTKGRVVHNLCSPAPVPVFQLLPYKESYHV